jgi:hypothetical protein
MWVVIWLAGAAVMVMGTGSDPSLCEQAQEMIIADISAGVVEVKDDTGKITEMYVLGKDGEKLPWAEWEVTCEDEHVKIGDTLNGG